jgi:hypothetical protein
LAALHVWRLNIIHYWIIFPEGAAPIDHAFGTKRRSKTRSARLANDSAPFLLAGDATTKEHRSTALMPDKLAANGDRELGRTRGMEAALAAQLPPNHYHE